MLLLEQWLNGEDAIRVADEAAVSMVRARTREVGIGLGDLEFVESCALIASELGHNQVSHCGSGFMQVRAIERAGVPGLEITAADAGPGIPPAVFCDSSRPRSGSLGAGLAAVQRLASEVDFDLRAGEGSLVRARKFSGKVALSRELAIVGRPLPGESISGDQAFVQRTPERLIACVLDGVGHGLAAREASDAAIEILGSQGSSEWLEIEHRLEAGLRGSRGCVLSRAVVAERDRSIEHAGVGNASTRLVGPTQSRRFVTTDGIIGQPFGRRRILIESAILGAGELIIMHTDGLTSSSGLAERPDLLFAPAIVVATYLLETFARPHDDALVLVIR